MRDQLIHTIKQGGIAVIPTDTIYGLVASAENPEAVGRLYRIRQRPSGQPSIILIGAITELAKFNITLSDHQRETLGKIWPSATSVILPCSDSHFAYLHRGHQSLAFRFPGDTKLQALLLETGPIIAPSANLQGQDPATTVSEARNYFGDQVDLYWDGGKIINQPSTLVRIRTDGLVEIVRRGQFKINPDFLTD